MNGSIVELSKIDDRTISSTISDLIGNHLRPGQGRGKQWSETVIDLCVVNDGRGGTRAE